MGGKGKEETGFLHIRDFEDHVTISRTQKKKKNYINNTGGAQVA